MSFFQKINRGLSKTRAQAGEGLSGALTDGRFTPNTREALEESLLAADMGYEAASRVAENVDKSLKGGLLSVSKLTARLEEEVLRYLNDPAPIAMDARPHTVLVLGVNGTGKTTSVAKLAAHHRSAGRRVLVAAADTFRAAATEQLEVWCSRAGADLVKHQPGSDSAAVAFDAWNAARHRGHEVLIIDTAGRLHNKDHLMEELKKMVRVLRKHGDELPHETLLVIDGTTGQNAIPQAKVFHSIQPLDGFIVTKLDGTSKGGALVPITRELGVPIRWLGVGEGLDDLVPFSAGDFASSLFRGAEFDIPLERQEVEDRFKGLRI